MRPRSSSTSRLSCSRWSCESPALHRSPSIPSFALHLASACASNAAHLEAIGSIRAFRPVRPSSSAPQARSTFYSGGRSFTQAGCGSRAAHPWCGGRTCSSTSRSCNWTFRESSRSTTRSTRRGNCLLPPLPCSHGPSLDAARSVCSCFPLPPPLSPAADYRLLLVLSLTPLRASTPCSASPAPSLPPTPTS